MVRRIRATLLVLISITFCSFAQAQFSLFEFVYRFETGKTEYKAFVLRNNDGTGFIRLRYIDTVDNNPIVLLMDLEENFYKDRKGKVDKNTLAITGKNPTNIYGNRNIRYEPPVFLFRLNKKTDEFNPAAVSTVNFKISAEFNQRLLQKPDLTSEFLLQYFLKDEDFYVNLFENNSRGNSNAGAGVQLFLIVVANTNDKSIGKTCVIDKENTLELFSDITDFLDIKFVPKEISGNNYSKTNVDRALAELKPTANDIVVFYYTGHGYGDKSDNYLFPHLDLRNDYSKKPGDPYQLSMEEIYKTIKAKGARFNLVMSDCCNSEIGVPPNQSSKVNKTRGSSVDWNMTNCESLFLNPKPHSILLTAASKGQESAGDKNTGGIFTFHITEAIQKYMSPVYKSPWWDQVMQSAQAATIKRAKATICPQVDGTFKNCSQIPIAKYN